MRIILLWAVCCLLCVVSAEIAVATSEVEASRLDELLESLSGRFEELETRVSQLESHVSTLQAQVGSLKAALQESESDLGRGENLLSELSQHERELADLAAKVAPAGTGPDLIESHIEGTFEGWDGETIFKLDNGQIWQQATYAYTYHYAYRPKVYIVKSYGAYKMVVEGVSGSIFVRRLK